MSHIAFCIECSEAGKEQRVEHRFGAWMCPVHRDRGHIRFDLEPPNATKVAKKAEQKAAPSYWPGDVPGGVPGVTDKEEVGPIGAGTPHARMDWFWERMRPHEKLVGELTGWSPLSNTYRWEAAIADAFDRLAEAKAESVHIERYCQSHQS